MNLKSIAAIIGIALLAGCGHMRMSDQGGPAAMQSSGGTQPAAASGSNESEQDRIFNMWVN